MVGPRKEKSAWKKVNCHLANEKPFDVETDRQTDRENWRPDTPSPVASYLFRLSNVVGGGHEREGEREGLAHFRSAGISLGLATRVLLLLLLLLECQ